MNALQKLVKVFRFEFAKAFWEDAVKAGLISSENQSSPAFKDGFLLGAFAIADTSSRKDIKRLRQKLLSSGGNLETLSYLMDVSVEDLWTQCSQFEMGGSNRKEPLFKKGFFAGAGMAYSYKPQIKKLVQELGPPTA